MMTDYDRPAAWIDYIIASDDPADKALISEYNARSWAYGQTNQALHKIGFNEESLDRMAEQQRLSEALQKRIRARGEELRAAGQPPANDAQIAAWKATWLPLAATLPSDDDPIHQA